ncbi:MAG: DUF1854 domain-containing protein [Gemmatimonadaceae bacterium]
MTDVLELTSIGNLIVMASDATAETGSTEAIEFVNSAFELRGEDDGRLFVMINDELVAVQLRQCFPWSQPTRYLSLWSGDGVDEREVALVDDPANLPPVSRAALEQALAAAGFVLQVTRVESIKEEVEIRNWSVLTKHGPRTFQTHLDDWPRELPDGALLIRDVAGDLYRLPPTSELDKKSKEVLWSLLD